jgi:hypothetical protein
MTHLIRKSTVKQQSTAPTHEAYPFLARVASIHFKGFIWQSEFIPFPSTPYIFAQTRGTQSVFVVPSAQTISSVHVKYSYLLIDHLKTAFVRVKESSENHLPSHTGENL